MRIDHRNLLKSRMTTSRVTLFIILFSGSIRETALVKINALLSVSAIGIQAQHGPGETKGQLHRTPVVSMQCSTRCTQLYSRRRLSTPGHISDLKDMKCKMKRIPCRTWRLRANTVEGLGYTSNKPYLSHTVASLYSSSLQGEFTSTRLH